MFNHKNSGRIEIQKVDREKFFVILTRIKQILSNESLSAQVQVMELLVKLLSQQEDRQFIKLLNSIDMWGGSGAVWEVHIEDISRANEFEIEMIKLINLMEDSKVLGRGIKPIRKIFMKNIQMRE